MGTEEKQAPGLNPGIRRMVAWLNSKGWPTCDSGDGKTHDHACDRDHAYVVVLLPDERAADVANESIRLRNEIEDAFPVSFHAVNCDELPSIEASFDPLNGFALINVSHVDDAMMWPEEP